MIVNLFTPETLQKIRLIFERNEVSYAGVFGSYAKNTADIKSDVDLLIEFKPESKKTLFDMVDLQEELKTVLNKDVDLVTKNSLNKYLKEEVLKTVKTLYG